MLVNPHVHTEQAILNSSFDEEFGVSSSEMLGYDSATQVLRRVSVDENGQVKTVGAAPVGGATSVNQDTLNSLIETLQELVQRLAPLASAMNAGAPALRTTPIASVSTAVTGTVAVSAVTNLTNFGTGIPASEMAHDMNNQTAILANINNASA